MSDKGPTGDVNEMNRREVHYPGVLCYPVPDAERIMHHRRIKQRIRPMLGFKRFDHAAITISGIELAEKIKKGQFKIGKLRNRKTTMSEQWSAALAA
jgi:hypothetical protein